MSLSKPAPLTLLFAYGLCLIILTVICDRCYRKKDKMKIAWLTDIHLDFPSPRTLVKFMRALKLSPADVIVISGDIASGPSVEHFLTKIGQKTARTLYFVLGNHDFYGSSFKTVRERVRLLTLSQPGLVWLSEKGVISLTGTTALIGHEGWADGRLGDYERSEVVLNDYLHIMEFQPSGFTGGTALRPKSERLLIMQRLADEAAAHFEKYLEEALQSHRAVLAITHVPPFEQASRYRGELC
ncbi:MAG: metallophosphoesterase, partial [candidate division Zixibacteria bacterium]|nr:metallophosphoesterase [candidate division Zixibacteria bacterium]